MKAIICLNGNPPSRDFLKSIISNSYIIAVDGACSYLIDYEIQADLIVGDFDSIKIDQAKTVLKADGDIVQHNPIKNYTDGQLALQEAINRGYNDICIVGAVGGRVDHEYENIRLLNVGNNASVKVIDEYCEIFLLCDRLNADFPINTVVSVLPYSDEVIIKNLKGFRYSADLLKLNKLDPFGHSGISNITIDKNVQITILKGIALIIVNFN